MTPGRITLWRASWNWPAGPPQALAEYRKTVRLDPSDAAAHNALAMLLEDRGRTAEALAQYRQAVALSPKDARLHFNLASALEAAGQGAAATGGV